MHQLLRDIRYAVRRLLRKPAFTAIAVLSVAIGIGANTAIFSLVNAIIIRDLPLSHPEELVDVYRSTAGFDYGTFSYPDLRDLRAETRDVFSGLVGSKLALLQADADGGVEQLVAELVSGDYFTVLGVPAYLGRTLLPEDDVAPGGSPVVMLGYGYWKRQFSGDPSVVGRSIRLGGHAYTVVGVVPERYTGNLRGLTPQIYAPGSLVNQLQPGYDNELEDRNSQSIFAKARLKPGVTLLGAQTALDRVAGALRERYPGAWQANNVMRAVPTSSVIMNPMVDKFIVPAAALLMAVVGLVLLIACANLASFLLAQAADRRKEVAVRMALGAGRGALIRQFLTETLLLAVAGGTVGVGLAVLLLNGLVNADLPLPLPITLDLSLDTTVLGFSLLLTLVAGILFGLAPALQATRPDIAPTLKDENTGGGIPKRMTLRAGLVVAQVAVSLALLVAAGLFLRSFQARLDIDPGFGRDPAAVVTMQVDPRTHTPEQTRVIYRTLMQQVGSAPGVRAVGLTGLLQLTSTSTRTSYVTVPGIAPPPDGDYYEIDKVEVDPGFFEAVGIPVVTGRGFDSRDTPDGTRVAIVSQAFARKFWPGEDAAGRSFILDDSVTTVIGVARDTKVRSLGEEPRPYIYVPYAQSFHSVVTVVARTAGPADRTVLDLVAAARRLDPQIMIFEAKTMDRHLAAVLLPHRLAAWIVSAFGLLALLLASIGLYGVVSYAVATRSREVGIRMALGAEPGGVVRMLMGSGLRLVLIGAGVGLGLAGLMSLLARGLVYGVSPFDPATFLLVPLLLVSVALLAAWIPARRASRVDVVRSLRAE